MRCFLREIDAKLRLNGALIMQWLMLCGYLTCYYFQKLQMLSKRTLNDHKQNQEMASWFSGDDDQWWSWLLSLIHKLFYHVTKSSRLCFQVPLENSKLLHNSNCSKDKGCSAAFDEVCKQTSEKTENTFCITSYILIEWSKVKLIITQVRLSLYRDLN